MATVRGRPTANAMMSAMSCAVMDVAAYVSSTDCFHARVGDVIRQLRVDRSGLDDDHAHVGQQLLPQRLRPAVHAPLGSRVDGVAGDYLAANALAALCTHPCSKTRTTAQQRPLHLPRRDLARVLRGLGACRQRPRGTPALRSGTKPVRSCTQRPHRRTVDSNRTLPACGGQRTTCVHHTGTKRLRHPIVGDVDLKYEVMPIPGDSLRLAVFTAEVGSRSADALDLLSSWSATTLADVTTPDGVATSRDQDASS